MPRRIIRFVLLLLPLIPVSVQAGGSGGGTITNINIISNGVILFNTSAGHTSAPSCASSSGRWAVNATTGGGQILASLILTAYAQGKNINVAGAGTCTAWADSEDISYIYAP